MSNTARDAVLGRVRSALAHAARTPWEDIPRRYAAERPAPPLVKLFRERVADYQATAEQVSADGVAEAVVAALRATGAQRLLAPTGIPPAWWDALREEFEDVDDGTDIDVTGLDSIDAVVTTAAVAIASTGTIVLDHGPGQGRRAATLVPDVHVCVVERSQIVDDVPAALTRLDPARPLTFISGPSATSDIELDRVEGVHGPRTLHVVVAGGRDDPP